jgi:tripeptidyl-peptidase-1
VESWLVSQDLEVFDSNLGRDMLYVRGTVKAWSSALHTSFHVYRHPKGAQVIKSQAYSLPESVARNVDLVVGLLGLPRLTEVKAHAISDVTLDNHIVPAVLTARYNVTDVGTNSANEIAVAEFVGQFYSPTDLTSFMTEFASNATSKAVSKIVGTNQGRNPGDEANLDIQYVMGVAQNVPAWFVIEAGGGTFQDFFSELAAWATWLTNTSDIPKVFSVSYGDQYENQPSGAYKFKLSSQFQQAGSLGISVIFASGDSGSGCIGCSSFQASFPATSPYVTSVGATQFISGSAGPEEASVAFPSGGGFSNHFAQPSWQSSAVTKYLNSAANLPKPSYYNATGRGTPDVAAAGVGFVIVLDGTKEQVDGTSCAAPTFSAIISLLNQARLAQGKPVLGYLNPWLYGTAAPTPGAFFDVTQGNNPQGCCHQGFPAAPGWDAVTGLGTPNYKVLKTIL